MPEPVVQVEVLGDIAEVFAREEIPPPDKAALERAQVWVLPVRRGNHFPFLSESIQTSKVAKEAGLSMKLYSPEGVTNYLSLHSADVFLPPLLVFFVQGAVQLPWSVFASYIANLLAAFRGGGTVRQTLYLKTRTRTIRQRYEGPLSGYKAIIDKLPELLDE